MLLATPLCLSDDTESYIKVTCKCRGKKMVGIENKFEISSHCFSSGGGGGGGGGGVGDFLLY